MKKPTKETAVKILDLLSHGLVAGLGTQQPGKMCVEAVVNAALGLPHGDHPPCVGSAVRAFKIKLNDCPWPSNQDRANGMRELALAQLGSNELDQVEFGKLMYLRGTQQLLPFVWRKEAEKLSNPDSKNEMLDWCEKMEAVITFDEAKKVAKSASASASAFGYAFAYAYAFASAYAFGYAYAFAYASAYASVSNPNTNTNTNADTAYYHDLLKRTAKVGVDVLKEMKSPGCKWLYLINKSK